MNYLVPNTILVSIFGYNLVNPYPEAIIASQKFALFENRYPQNKNNVSFGYPELHMSMHKFISLILYVEYYSTKYFIKAWLWTLIYLNILDSRFNILQAFTNSFGCQRMTHCI